MPRRRIRAHYEQMSEFERDDAGKDGSTTADFSSERQWSIEGHNRVGGQSDCRSRYTTGFVVINHALSGSHTCVQYDPPHTTEIPKLTLAPTTTPLTSHACAPSSPDCSGAGLDQRGTAPTGDV
ncbi:hypothetical protein TNCV_1632681 [Trichonephila clavipes]|nr:hypothetical protein TNCV_1632681 [Trichonephila clavipes]